MKTIAPLLLGALMLLVPTLAPPASAQDVKVEYGIDEEELGEDSSNTEDEDEKNMSPQERTCRKECESRGMRCMKSCRADTPCYSRCGKELDVCTQKCEPKQDDT
jgi:hypothetical protein